MRKERGNFSADRGLVKARDIESSVDLTAVVESLELRRYSGEKIAASKRKRSSRTITLPVRRLLHLLAALLSQRVNVPAGILNHSKWQ